MDIFDILNLIGGLSLFLFGMNTMGEALERRAGNKLTELIGKLTTNKFTAFLTGLAVTAIIQSSSATTVMVVGFVNAGVMTLKQSIGVIMGANIGTTVTAWILSLGGIDGDALLLQFLKPTSFTPVLALIGVILYVFLKSRQKKDTGLILLGFAVLIFGMDTMSAAVSGLRDVPAFAQLFVMFKEPVLGVVVGAVLTAIIQSSSASVGILQALTVTGQISYGAAIPIIMGQNIGTCVTALLSSFGTNRNAKRVAFVHLSFNVIGTIIMTVVLYVVRATAAPVFLDTPANHVGIAVAHSVFNVVCTTLLLPMSSILEKLVYILVPDKKAAEVVTELDDRLLLTPAIALEQTRLLTVDMARGVAGALADSIQVLFHYDTKLAERIRTYEDKSDHYEDVIGSYLVKLSSYPLTQHESAEAASLLRLISDFERISDHSVNILESAEELRDKGIRFTPAAVKEMEMLTDAVREIVSLSADAFVNGNYAAVGDIEPLEELIDAMKEQLRVNHIRRLQQGECTIVAGFVWSDLLTNLERTADHCSNIAACLCEHDYHNMNMHEVVRNLRNQTEHFNARYAYYAQRFGIASVQENM